jgi:ATP-dependent DNA helicase RecQ
MPAEIDLLTPLKRYWGYSMFRPLQERIVRSLLAGNDTCVVMPTGGGKSLCYQLPAVASQGTVVVISPLIALMQDQATQLAQMGIPAAVLNSTLTEAEQSKVLSRAREGAFRLLYVSPERIARGDTMGWLQQVPIAFFAIDEAIASPSGDTNSVPNTASSAACAANFPIAPSQPSQPAPRGTYGTTFSRNCNCAIPINILPASTAPTFVTWCASVKAMSRCNYWSTPCAATPAAT